MSGPKCSKASLSESLLAELRRQWKAERERRRREEEERRREALERAKKARNEAEQAVSEVKAAYESVDRDFVSKWTSGKMDEIPEKIKQLEVQLARKDFSEVPSAARKIQDEIESIKREADETYAKEKKRETIVDGILDALEDMDFAVGANLADEKNPLDSVIISANHPSGQEVQMEVDLNTEHIQMNLDDDETTGSRVGADCVATVSEIISRLEEKGIEMEMTDWGYADPERVKRAGDARQLPRQRERARTRGA